MSRGGILPTLQHTRWHLGFIVGSTGTPWLSPRPRGPREEEFCERPRAPALRHVLTARSGADVGSNRSPQRSSATAPTGAVVTMASAAMSSKTSP